MSRRIKRISTSFSTSTQILAHDLASLPGRQHPPTQQQPYSVAPYLKSVGTASVSSAQVWPQVKLKLRPDSVEMHWQIFSCLGHCEGFHPR
ncbi:hypothetical protein PDIG_11940 [Penicillium digitatum PHI26]|uniref:Uncharacterized protein n=2 Tax=Penicillium digitatum TaxID=36651 RepID=K9GTT4_PEND2|nr:hypothetical protein PDIP_38160 [Penicillium digitatum Pd1]EKV16028.1 hypothetical protein PDIP_38160 [Penicillium digitatum Pd1]EKV18023.1 hypothetical protein PDIG_11940 [Penicillium digitatum PHI26]